MFNLFKKKKVEEPKPAPPKFTYETFKLMDQDYDFNDKFLRKHKEELDENYEYDLSKKELLEDYSGKVYRYDPTKFPCEIKDDKVYIDDNIVGRIKKTDLKLIGGGELYLMFYAGKHKRISGGDVWTDSSPSYFTLEQKKKAAE